MRLYVAFCDLLSALKSAEQYKSVLFGHRPVHAATWLRPAKKLAEQRHSNAMWYRALCKHKRQNRRSHTVPTKK